MFYVNYCGIRKIYIKVTNLFEILTKNKCYYNRRTQLLVGGILLVLYFLLKSTTIYISIKPFLFMVYYISVY